MRKWTFVAIGLAILGCRGLAAEPTPELAYVHPESFGFAHVRLAEIWKNPALKDARSIIEKAGPDAFKLLDEQFVPKPSTVERATLVVLPMDDLRSEPKFVAILRFSAPFDPVAVRNTYLPRNSPKKAGPKEYFTDELGQGALYLPDNQTMIAGDAKTLGEYLTWAPKTDGPLMAAVKAAPDKPVTVALNLNRVPIPPEAVNEIPPEFKPLMKAQILTATMDFTKDVTVNARISFATDAEATEGEKSVAAGFKLMRSLLVQQRKEAERMLNGRKESKIPGRPRNSRSPWGIALLGAINTVDDILANPPLKRDGTTLSAEITLPNWTTQYFGAAALSAGLALPALQKAREAAARAQSSNNLKQIALAMHNHESAFGKLPAAAICDKKGKKLLSWRVQILPYLEQDALYRQFKLDEPWDSEHNKKLIPIMPKTYADARMPVEPGKTYYKVFVGKDAGFDWVVPKNFANFTDGLSNTMMCAAAGEPVIWTKPEDFEFDPAKELPDLSKPFGILVFALFDGSVRTMNFPPGKDRSMLLKLFIQPNDGMVIPDF